MQQKSLKSISKRFFDFNFALLGLLVLWPFGLLIALAVKLTSKGPVFYKQSRIGQLGKPFTCIKFRTMYMGSDKQGSITAASDSRITPVGRFLRRYKLDEFPQLLNVLIGRMSFVGPRPDVPGYADKLTGEERKILELKPGITGPASIYFRNEEEILAGVDDPVKYNDEVIWPQKVKINLGYYHKSNLLRDIGYIIVTVVPGLGDGMGVGEGEISPQRHRGPGAA